jgi:large subunit ribosomal protein L14
MLRERSIVEIADNSGAVLCMLFSVSGKNKRRSVSVGDVVMGSVKKASVGGKVKKGQKVAILITATRRKLQRKDGSSIRFSRNLGVVVKKGGREIEMVATRVFGPVARELRDAGFNKVVSLAEEVL